LPSRSDGREVDAEHAVSPGGPFLGRSGEAIESRHDPRIVESRSAEPLDKLCFQQSTCNSTGPEIDVT
jgi:hypothetical protein